MDIEALILSNKNKECHKLQLNMNYDIVYEAILNVTQNMGKVKSSDRNLGVIFYRAGLMAKNPANLYIKFLSMVDGNLNIEITVLGTGTLIDKHHMKKKYAQFTEMLSTELKIPIEGLSDNSFNATKIVKGYLEVDENKRKWSTANNFGRLKTFDYEDIVNFELIEDGETIFSGGLGRAAAGALIFGGVGAIVGGVTGGKKSKSLCTSLMIKISINNIQNPVEYINFINTPTKKKSSSYQSAFKLAQECLSILEIICQDVENNSLPIKANSDTGSKFSEADEILKFKNLLDAGIITEDEFEQKKKQLLGL